MERCLEDPEIENYSEAIPSFISLRSHIDRLLVKYRPPMPHSILDIELSAEYAMTTRNEHFEAAAISALKFVFPSMIIKGCFSHYSQALWRRCQSLGLDLMPYFLMAYGQDIKSMVPAPTII
ncbi:unnamed protein product [Gordionus sp. m RMFG-2023]